MSLRTLRVAHLLTLVQHYSNTTAATINKLLRSCVKCVSAGLYKYVQQGGEGMRDYTPGELSNTIRTMVLLHRPGQCNTTIDTYRLHSVTTESLGGFFLCSSCWQHQGHCGFTSAHILHQSFGMRLESVQ